MNTNKPKRGRPPKGTAEKQVRVYSFLLPAERDFLARTYGTVYAGIQQLVRDKISAKNPPSRLTAGG